LRRKTVAEMFSTRLHEIG